MNATMILLISQLMATEGPAMIKLITSIVDDIKGGKEVTTEEIKSRMETMVSQEYQLVDRDPPA